MNKLIVILGAILLISCEALKKGICPDCNETPIYHHFYDTVAFVSISRRDTIPIFKGTKIFFGSSYDSVCVKDSKRYLAFEIMNYGSEDYVVSTDKYLNLISEVEVSGVVRHSDTLVINDITAGGSRNYNLKYPAEWFKSKSGENLPYHYRISITDQAFNIIDAYYPIPLNEKLPEKKYDEVTGDTVIYWQRPTLIIHDTTLTVFRVGYAYKDTLLFIDDIVGCTVYSHYFDGNKFYNFSVDTCLKLLCNKEITDNNTESISALLVKAYPDVPGAKMEFFINDTLSDQVSYSLSDSMFVGLIVKPFKDIKSVRLSSDSKWTIIKGQINSYNLLAEPTITLKNVTKVGDSYEFNPGSKVSLTASWLFNNNGNDETGRYPLTITTPVSMFEHDSPVEGSHFISFQGSDYYAGAGVVPIGDAFTICFYFKTWNEDAADRALLGNTKVYYPNGFIFYMDEVNKMMRFATGDGTYDNRKFVFSSDGSWSPGKWVHVAVTGSRITGLGKIYINGVDRTRGSSTGVFKTFKTVTPLLLGRSSDPSQSWSYMDAIKIYDKELNASEVAKVYNGESITNTTASISFDLR